MLNVHKASLFEVLAAEHGSMRRRPKFGERLHHQVAESQYGPVRRQGAIIAMDRAVDILELHPSAGFRVASR